MHKLEKAELNISVRSAVISLLEHIPQQSTSAQTIVPFILYCWASLHLHTVTAAALLWFCNKKDSLKECSWSPPCTKSRPGNQNSLEIKEFEGLQLSKLVTILGYFSNLTLVNSPIFFIVHLNGKMLLHL